MRITLNILLEALGLPPQSGALPANGGFLRAVPLDSLFAEPDPDYLYITPLSQVLEQPSGCPVCLCADDIPIPRGVSLPPQLILIPGWTDSSALLCRVQDVFFRLNQWFSHMQSSVISHQGLQSLLDLSEPILGNTINISDSALTLVAYTRHIETDDPISLSLHEKGYHDEHSMSLFSSRGCAAQWALQEQIYQTTDRLLSPYDMLSKVFSFQSTYFNHVVMVCDHAPLTPGLQDLFSTLVDILAVCIEAEWRQHQSCLDHTSTALLHGLIENTWAGSEELEQTACEAGLPLSGQFLLLRFRFPPELSVSRIIRELGDLLPGGKAAHYHGTVVLLLHGTSNSRLLSADTEARLEYILEKYHARCGLSECYSLLRSTSVAYRQASLALRYSLRLQECQLLAEPAAEPCRRLSHYGQNSAYYLLGANEDGIELWRQSPYGRHLYRLYQFDLDHHGCNLQLLYTYLNCERNATLTGQLLHMHRNNVVYHMGKIVEFLDIDLEDPHVRFSLLVSYAMLKLNGMDSGTE